MVETHVSSDKKHLISYAIVFASEFRGSLLQLPDWAVSLVNDWAVYAVVFLSEFHCSLVQLHDWAVSLVKPGFLQIVFSRIRRRVHDTQQNCLYDV